MYPGVVLEVLLFGGGDTTVLNSIPQRPDFTKCFKTTIRIALDHETQPNMPAHAKPATHAPPGDSDVLPESEASCVLSSISIDSFRLGVIKLELQIKDMRCRVQHTMFEYQVLRVRV